jgi:carboxypeptidase PM20D1
MLRDPRTAALLRTTFAATKAQGGPAHNVLPKYAEALVNTRIAPQDNLQSVGRHVRRIAPRDVKVELTLGTDPTGAAPTDSYEYRLLEEVLRDVFPEIIAVPSMMVGGTDAKKFAPVCSCILRFSPFLSQAKDAGTIHNVNERLSLDSFYRAAVFFIHYLGKL